MSAYPVLLDVDNLLGSIFGFKSIPNGIFVNTEGKIDAIKAGGFDIRDLEIQGLIVSWISDNRPPLLTPPGTLEWPAISRTLFLSARDALEGGDQEEAIRLLKLAHRAAPDNLIILKQLWAIEDPERFYGREIDSEWQHRQRQP